MVNSLRTALYAIFGLLLSFTIGAQNSVAQQPDSQSSGSSSSASQSSLPPSAEIDLSSVSNLDPQVQQLLTERPELIQELKKLIVASAQSQGSAIDEDAITDPMVLKRLQTDPDFRAKATTWFTDQGYLASPDEAPLGNDEQDQNPDARRGTTGTRRPGTRVPYTGTGQDNGAVTSRREAGKRPDNQLNPETTPLISPYPALPSFRDLYQQFSGEPQTLKRFGADLFLPSRAGLSTFPTDLPAGPDYVLGSGDSLTINIFGGASQRLSRIVDREGRVDLPEIGPILVAGMSLADAEKRLQIVLRPVFRNASVDLAVARVHAIRVYVVGDVQRPGGYDISALSTPLNALYAAGGPTNAGSLRTVKHSRGGRVLREVDLYDLLIKGAKLDSEHLQSGDTILVPPIGPQVAVAGIARRPAIYELRQENQLIDVLELAGGVPVSADLAEIDVDRINPHRDRVTLQVKISREAAQKPLREAIPPFAVQDGDRITIHPILPYSSQAVYLQGHVYHPGKYSFREGMRVSDLLQSYRDILPEPASHAEIIRLLPPDLRPQAIPLDLPEILAGGDSPLLQPLDTVRVFGRYQFDAPKVFIHGAVLRPGEFPLSNGMTVSMLVKLAGGFRRSAFTRTGELATYTIESGSRVVTTGQSVDLAAALMGDSAADVVLKPGDVLTILELTGWKDIGASVNVIGEVMFPGTYGFREGERLSSVLKRIGGFRPSAYATATVLERVEVRNLAEKGRQELIRRIEASGAMLKIKPSGSGQDQAAMLQAMQVQQQQALTQLRAQQVPGRLVVNISNDIAAWENTPSDIELRPGDTITIPKKPDFVVCYGQVNNPTAITYAPGKTAEWYLQQGGGPTDLAKKSGIYIIRANGSVVAGGGGGFFRGGVLSTRMHPGDILVVPERAIGTDKWKVWFDSVQVLTSLAIAAKVATSF